MSGLSLLLETARRALNAQQLGISVTGHNIANASTPGFSRQRAELVPHSPFFRGTASSARGSSDRVSRVCAMVSSISRSVHQTRQWVRRHRSSKS